jgi:hypothetical protein
MNRPNGIVFVSYARADSKRVMPLVAKLEDQFNVFCDKGLRAGENWQRGLEIGLGDARCVLGLFTANLGEQSYAVQNEMAPANTRGILLPAKLDVVAKVPGIFKEVQYLDVSGWSGKGVKMLSDLFLHIHAYLLRPPPFHSVAPDWQRAVSNSSQAVTDLRQLATQVSTIGGVLSASDGPVADVNSTLKEIHATCAATLEAIDRFLEPAKRADQGLLEAYLNIPGELRDMVNKKRGHCSRILEHYGRAGGVREWLLPRAKRHLVGRVDRAFEQLSTADNDLFDSVSQIGAMLDDEATYIRGLLLRGQGARARERLNKAQIKLLPLRRKLSDFIAQFYAKGSGMGFVPQ